MTQENDIAHYSVGIVGGMGTGKTTYLAAMHNYLSAQRKNVGFYLDAPNQANELIAMFDMLANQHKWLPKTQYDDISDWDLSIWAKGTAKPWEACRFTYYDYAGELVDGSLPEHIPFRKNIGEKLQRCSALIGLLDGAKISHFVLGTNQKAQSAFRTRDLPYLNNALKRGFQDGDIQSLQFVITKWDQVQRTGATFDQIKAFLLSLPEFKDFLDQFYKQSMPCIRLIPVSSVGFKYVRAYDADNNAMLIDENETPEPWNVAYPLACIFVDVLRKKLEALKQKQSEASGKQYKSRSFIDDLVLDLGKLALEYMPRKYRGNVKLFQILYDIIEEKTFSMQDREEARYQAFLKAKEDSLSQLQDNESAFQHAARMCKWMQDELDSKFPGNVLKDKHIPV